MSYIIIILKICHIDVIVKRCGQYFFVNIGFSSPQLLHLWLTGSVFTVISVRLKYQNMHHLTLELPLLVGTGHSVVAEISVDILFYSHHSHFQQNMQFIAGHFVITHNIISYKVTLSGVLLCISRCQKKSGYCFSHFKGIWGTEWGV